MFRFAGVYHSDLLPLDNIYRLPLYSHVASFPGRPSFFKNLYSAHFYNS